MTKHDFLVNLISCISGNMVDAQLIQAMWDAAYRHNGYTNYHSFMVEMNDIITWSAEDFSKYRTKGLPQDCKQEFRTFTSLIRYLLYVWNEPQDNKFLYITDLFVGLFDRFDIYKFD